MKRGFQILKLLGRVYILHISAILAIWLAMYYSGLDIILSIIYLFLLWEEGKYTHRMLRNPKKQALIASLWQLPGFVLGTSVIIGIDRVTDLAYYFVFMLELWVTPILPLVSLLPHWTIMERPIYYYLLFVMVPLLAVYYYVPVHRTISENS